MNACGRHPVSNDADRRQADSDNTSTWTAGGPPFGFAEFTTTAQPPFRRSEGPRGERMRDEIRARSLASLVKARRFGMTHECLRRHPVSNDARHRAETFWFLSANVQIPRL